VNNRLPSREQALQLLQQTKCPPQVISHCLAVSELSLELANQLRKKGLKINIQLVEVGAILHDIGRSESPNVDHSVIGSQIAKSMNLPDPLVNIIKRHVGAGITEDEAKEMGWPEDNYVPQTLEEKIVAYADKRIDKGMKVPIEIEIKRLQDKNRPEAAERIKTLHDEITSLLGKEL
jgi:uncharacterized protein